MFLQAFLNNANQSRKTVFVNVKPNFNVSELKLELFKSVKIPVPRQVIEFSGTILTDDFLVANAHNKNRADLFAYDGQKLVCRLRFRDKKELKESLLISMMSRNNEKPLDAQSELVGLADGSSSASSPTSSISSSAMSTRIPVFACVRPFVNEQSCGDTCEVNCCDEGGEGRPPYARIMPEDRRYGIVITNEGDPCDCNFDCVLQHLVESFHSAVDVTTLSFSQCTPAVSFECFLLMECRDSDTSDWLQRAMRPMNPPYLCSTFIEHFELVRCSFVVPMVVERELCRVFHIMEKQNCGLDSSKWCVVRKTTLDPCSEDYAKKVVFDGFPNYELVVYMDNCSKVYIEKQCGKVLFLMWHLSVDFD